MPGDKSKKIPRIGVFAPGKVILHGEHAVVYYKKAVAVSVSLFTNLDIFSRPADCEEVTLLFPAIDLDLRIKLKDIRALQSRLEVLNTNGYCFSKLNAQEPIPLESNVQEAIQEFIRENPDLFQALKTQEPSQHSSGQLKATEAFLGLFAAIFDGDKLAPLLFQVKTELPVGAGLGSSASFGAALVAGMLRWTGHISKSLTVQDQLDINRWTFFSEKFVHGSPSGIDNHVATYGGAVVFQRHSDGMGEEAEAIPCPEIRVVLVDTKVPRSTHQVIQKVRELKERSLETWTKIIDDIGLLVEDAVAEIRDKNSMKPELFMDNHRLLQSLGVSHPALDKIIDIGAANGFSGKLTGAGGGGCAFIFIPGDVKEGAVIALKNLLTQNKFGFWETKLGCPGVYFDDVDDVAFTHGGINQ